MGHSFGLSAPPAVNLQPNPRARVLRLLNDAPKGREESRLLTAPDGDWAPARFIVVAADRTDFRTKRSDGRILPEGGAFVPHLTFRGACWLASYALRCQL